ncbi:MAG: hypothetical protein ACD_42C00327G0002 [uncultured bacterium]|nr:MAG: hypothetical protein ACD_42C00327G0002 [uncultured bacterium]
MAKIHKNKRTDVRLIIRMLKCGGYNLRQNDRIVTF